MQYLNGSKEGVPKRLVATFGSEQQSLAYVRWTTLQDLGDHRGKFEPAARLPAMTPGPGSIRPSCSQARR
jgi:hypothetical protein